MKLLSHITLPSIMELRYLLYERINNQVINNQVSRILPRIFFDRAFFGSSDIVILREIYYHLKWILKLK